MGRQLVAGVDSSTQSCKIVVREAITGKLVRFGAAAHASGTEVDPDIWWDAFLAASEKAGGLADVDAISIAGQQHGMVALDDSGHVIRNAILWNDTRSASDASDLISALGRGDTQVGAHAWAEQTGSVPVASITVTKLRWMARQEPGNAERVAAVALPHDYLSWRLTGSGNISDLWTDRSDASGTGYFDPVSSQYRRELLSLALGREGNDLVLPKVLAPGAVGGTAAAISSNAVIGAGCGDNAGAALGLGVDAGVFIMSLGTSGVVSMISARSVHDQSGLVNGFADAAGGYLPLACTLNATRTLDAFNEILGVDRATLSDMAMQAPSGSEGLVLVPYLEGERMPNKPDATGSLHGLTLKAATRGNIARAAVEGMLCGVGAGVDALVALGLEGDRVCLVGGGARSEAVRTLAPEVLGLPIFVPDPGEYVADGAARQAAWALGGETEPPAWQLRLGRTYVAKPTPFVRERYEAVRDSTMSRTTLGLPW